MLAEFKVVQRLWNFVKRHRTPCVFRMRELVICNVVLSEFMLGVRLSILLHRVEVTGKQILIEIHPWQIAPSLFAQLGDSCPPTVV